MGNGQGGTPKQPLASHTTRLSEDVLHQLENAYGGLNETHARSDTSRKMLAPKRLRGKKCDSILLVKLLDGVPRVLHPFIITIIQPYVTGVSTITFSDLTRIG